MMNKYRDSGSPCLTLLRTLNGAVVKSFFIIVLRMFYKKVCIQRIKDGPKLEIESAVWLEHEGTINRIEIFELYSY